MTVLHLIPTAQRGAHEQIETIIERLRSLTANAARSGSRFTDQRSTGSLARGITASVIGVIASLSLALHLFFTELTAVTREPLSTLIPQAASFQPLPLEQALHTGGLLLWRHWSITAMLGISAALYLAANTV